MAADSKAKLLHDAEKYVLHGKVQQAIGEYLKVIKYDPDDVLILNTVGDLYLRQGNRSEANKYFSRVAEAYVRNNFFLKAIAVYKKILSADPDHLEISLTTASLYAKQGLIIDARNQYLRVAALLEKAGRSEEIPAIYEKVVELDPANATVQRMLAELHLAQGAEDKAHARWMGAAQAQLKAGDSTAAADSFERALNINPIDMQALRGLVACCVKTGRLAPAIEILRKAVAQSPDNPDLHEMLGNAFLAGDDLDNAAAAFKAAAALDENRYANALTIAQAWIERSDYDRAAACLDDAAPTMIYRRNTDRAVELYGRILQGDPYRVDTMERLASIYSAVGDQPHYLEMLESIVDCHLNAGRSSDLLDALEKMLRANPGSEKHRRLHQQVFSEVNPETPYHSPVERSEDLATSDRPAPASAEGGAPTSLVEIDLLINYGMRDKALGLLRDLERRDPYDREVRFRLLSLLKEEGQGADAAEQSLLLAALERCDGHEDEMQRLIAEAKQLDPGLTEDEQSLAAFAARHGIRMEIGAAGLSSSESREDLSSDLISALFPEEAHGVVGDVAQEIAPEPFPQEGAAGPMKSVQEQLQEVDFYIGLGFHEEARAKLDEIARLNPDNLALSARYESLGGAAAPDEGASAIAEARPEEAPPRESLSGAPEPATEDIFEGLDLDFLEGGDSKASSALDAIAPPAQPSPDPAPRENAPEANEMFADLLKEIDELPDLGISADAYEEHFSLGTAYREMELVEEAIKEFELAWKAVDRKKEPRKAIQCCGILSTCYLKKGMHHSALLWCRTGLEFPDISSHEALAFRYDMGVAHLLSGEPGQALDSFEQIFRVDPSYRDVAQRIDELKGGS